MNLKLSPRTWLLVGIAFVIGGLWVFPFHRVTFDLTWLVAGVAVTAAAGLLFKILLHRQAPRRVFMIETSVSFRDPQIPLLGRHTFQATIKVKEMQKEEWSLVNQKTVELVLRGSSASQFRTKCMELITRAVEEQRAAVKEIDPTAKIVVEEQPQDLVRCLPG